MSILDAVRIGQKPDDATLLQTQLWIQRVVTLLDDMAVHGAQYHHREAAQHLLGWASELRLRNR